MANQILILTVAKTQPGAYSQLVDDFLGRVKHYYPTIFEVIPEAKGMSDPLKAREKEGKLILTKLKPQDTVVLLDEKGKLHPSMAFAQQLEDWMNQGAGRLVFVLGGAHGFSAEVYGRATSKLSLSPFTMPHQLARVVFLEQLYRACTIQRNEPYHHV